MGENGSAALSADYPPRPAAKHMIVVRRQVRRPGLPQPLRGTCDKPCRFARLCGNQNPEVFRHLPKRAGSHAYRQSGYTLSEHVVWNTNLVQTGSLTARLNTSFWRSSPCLDTLRMCLAYPCVSLGQPLTSLNNHEIHSRWHERRHALHV